MEQVESPWNGIDCIMLNEIFSHLSISDLIKAEHVCEKWSKAVLQKFQQLFEQNSYCMDIDKLFDLGATIPDLKYMLKFHMKSYYSFKYTTNIPAKISILKCLEYWLPHIKKFVFMGKPIHSTEMKFLSASKHFNYLAVEIDPFVPCEQMKDLFQKNSKLYYLKLIKHICNYPKECCFSFIPNIETLILQFCSLYSLNYISRLPWKNIVKLEVFQCLDVPHNFVLSVLKELPTLRSLICASGLKQDYKKSDYPQLPHHALRSVTLINNDACNNALLEVIGSCCVNLTALHVGFVKKIINGPITLEIKLTGLHSIYKLHNLTELVLCEPRATPPIPIHSGIKHCKHLKRLTLLSTDPEILNSAPFAVKKCMDLRVLIVLGSKFTMDQLCEIKLELMKQEKNKIRKGLSEPEKILRLTIQENSLPPKEIKKLEHRWLNVRESTVQSYFSYYLKTK